MVTAALGKGSTVEDERRGGTHRGPGLGWGIRGSEGKEKPFASSGQRIGERRPGGDRVRKEKTSRSEEEKKSPISAKTLA